MDKDKKFLKKAIFQAEKSFNQGGFPAGAVIEKDGKIISEGISLGGLLNDPTEHSETSAIRKACQKLKTTNLSNCTLYAALQPCLMCFSVANWVGIPKIIYGCKKTDEMAKRNYYEGLNQIDEINNKNNRQIEIVYIGDFENECLNIIKRWEQKNN
jgi:tRNA(Arg) A34 adenosine deaminase TadA